jgi:hypothetical protein
MADKVAREEGEEAGEDKGDDEGVGAMPCAQRLTIWVWLMRLSPRAQGA